MLKAICSALHSTQVRHWTNEIASLVSVGETVNPWGLTYEEVANNLSEASNALGESWTRLLFGGEGSDHNGIAYVSSTIEKEIFAPGCLRKDKDTCLQPGDPNYAKSVEGLNQTMRTYVVEALMFAGQDPSTFSKEQFEYLWYIGSIDLEDGVHRVSRGPGRYPGLR